MTTETIGKFFANVRQKLFNRRIDREIYDRIFPHLEQEKDRGYPFDTDAEMNAQTEEFNVQALLDSIEWHAARMPKAYGESFRHIMHRDLHARLCRYAELATRRVQPETCDSRFVATHA
jgi:hypothetical protein